MPSKNSLKIYVEDGYYHIYNRGVEKRRIFLDEEDCNTFLKYMKLYLLPPQELRAFFIEEPRIQRFIQNNLYDEVELFAFSLMPNHFHLGIKQKSANGMIKFMRRLTTAYVMYFNNKYERVGSLVQNRYKATLIISDPHLMHLSRYIHRNPLGIKTTVNFLDYTSYSYYLGEKTANWVHPQHILSYFKTSQISGDNDLFSYKNFMEDLSQKSRSILGDLTLE